MTDHELLELAAKAAGYTVLGDMHPSDGINIECDNRTELWRPLTNDGDALRLAVRLRIYIEQMEDGWACAWARSIDFEEPHGKDPYAATRRAIVRAAAEIAKA